MRAEELLSQDEINALLDISDNHLEKTPDSLKKRPIDALLEDVSKDIRRYLQTAGLEIDRIDILPKTPLTAYTCKHFEDQPYRLEVCIENRLADLFIGVLFGGGAAENTRSLSSLDLKLLAPLLSTLHQIMQKHIRLNGEALRQRKGEKVEACFKLSFHGSNGVIKVLLSEETPKQKRPEKAYSPAKQTDSSAKTVKVEAVIGMICTDKLVKGIAFRLDEYTFNEAVLFMENRPVFRAAVLDNAQDRLTLLLEKTLSKPEMSGGYYVCIAGKTIEAKSLLATKPGRSLELDLYPTAEIHKAGKTVAQAKVFVKDGTVVAAPV